MKGQMSWKIWCIILVLFCLSFAADVNIDQQFFTNSFTDVDFANWNFYGATVPSIYKFTTCAGTTLFGGYNVFTGDSANPNGIVRTWSNLISHYSVRIQATVYKIDSWTNSTFFAMVDGTSAALYTWNSSNGGTVDICGNPSPFIDSVNTNYNELITNINVTVPHSSSSLTVNFTSNLPNNLGFWGIKNIMITLQACDYSCNTCTDGITCTSCNTANGLTLSGILCSCTLPNINQALSVCTIEPCVSCVLSCSTGYYYEAATANCQPCNVACVSCIGPQNSLSQCFGCAMGFWAPNSSVACSSCYSGCASCNGLLSTNCLSCRYMYFLSGSQCLTSCPAGTFSSQLARSCTLCVSPCATCNGGTSQYCLTCISSYYLLSKVCYLTCPSPYFGFNKTCTTQCPQTTFPNSLSRLCSPCISLCLQCTNSTGCFICSTGNFINNGICYASCPLGTYGSLSTGTCVVCDPNCQTCSGPSSNNCLSCISPAILISGTCYSTCPTNTYSALCLPCDPTCLTCIGPSINQCLSCESPYFYHLNLSTCVSSCATGEISNNFNFTCQTCAVGQVSYFLQCVYCNPTCATCFGVTFLECSSCDQYSNFVVSTCVSNSNSKVVYSPSQPQTSEVGQLFLTLLVTHILFCIFLQIIFEYKTNLLLTIQLFQMLSYTYYLSIQMSQSTQNTLIYMYQTNFAAYFQPIKTQSGQFLTAKFAINNKEGVYLADAFFLHIIMLVAVFILLLIKSLRKYVKFIDSLYKKLNPYLISYLFRLVILELALDLILFLANFDSSSAAGISSIVLIAVDAFILFASFCWKIKTEEDSTQFALFYDNEIGQSIKNNGEKYINQTQTDQQNMRVQQKMKKIIIFPSIIRYIIKIPLPIAILFFIKNGSTQTICVFIYCLFCLIITALTPYRRKIYKWTCNFCSIILVLNSVLCILIQKTPLQSIILEFLWLITLIILLSLSVMQLITNYHYFVNLIHYAKEQICPPKTQKDEVQTEIHNNSEANIMSETHNNIFQNDFNLKIASKPEILSIPQKPTKSEKKIEPAPTINDQLVKNEAPKQLLSQQSQQSSPPLHKNKFKVDISDIKIKKVTEQEEGDVQLDLNL